MNFFKNIFSKTDTNPAINSPQDFWNWFVKNEKRFHAAVNGGETIHEGFLEPLGEVLPLVHDNIYYLAGMYDDNTAELILTAEGEIKNFVFVEDLVKLAPALPNWKFTALKDPMEGDGWCIEKEGIKYDFENIHFCPINQPEYPDEIAVMIIHDDYTEENHNEICNGCLIFLDNYLGELNFAQSIDRFEFGQKADAPSELNPIHKLASYINWREKEFIEKYDGTQLTSSEDQHAVLEARNEDDLPIIAAVASDLLKCDKKPSYPWMISVEINYNGEQNNGLPYSEDYALLNEIEDVITGQLNEKQGCLWLARESGNNLRTIYIACKEFRNSSRIVYQTLKKYQDKYTADYTITKDKYWLAVERFNL